MLSIALEIEWFLIDQEPCSIHADRTHTVRKRVNILAEGHFNLIQIRFQRLPQMYVFDFQHTFRSAAFCDFPAFAVERLHKACTLALCLHLIDQLRIVSVYLGDNGNVGNIILRRCINADWTVDSGVVEKVKVWMIDRLFLRLLSRISHHAAHHIGFSADRQRGVVDDIADCHSQKILARLQFFGQFHFKRQKSALMGRKKFPVQIDACMVCHGITPEHYTLSFYKGRNGNFFLIKDPSIVLAVCNALRQIVVG